MKSKLLLALSIFAAVSLQITANAQMYELDNEPVAPSISVQDKEPGATPCMIWMPPGGPKKGILVAVHGLSLHKGCYKDFAERMNALGWGVYAVDVRGFGTFQKMEKGARKVDFEGCMRDVKDALDLVHNLHPGMPVFIVGESMGGGIALQAGSRYQEMISGIISSCPASERHHTFSASVRVGANLLTGQHSVDIRPIVIAHSTKKAELKEEWGKDTLARIEMSPIELIQFQHFMDHNHEAARKLTKVPIIILQGTADDLVKKEGQLTLLADVPLPQREAGKPATDKELMFVQGSEHLILEENQFNDGVIDHLSGWLDSHLPKQTASKTQAE